METSQNKNKHKKDSFWNNVENLSWFLNIPNRLSHPIYSCSLIKYCKAKRGQASRSADVEDSPEGQRITEPAEILKHTFSKDFRKIWGLRALRVTENLILHTFSYVGSNFDFFPHNRWKCQSRWSSRWQIA